VTDDAWQWLSVVLSSGWLLFGFLGGVAFARPRRRRARHRAHGPIRVTGGPGAGCTDRRSVHTRWCGFCGARLAFSSSACATLQVVPPCPRCGEKDWRNECDELQVT
jgi:hypothetical protein